MFLEISRHVIGRPAIGKSLPQRVGVPCPVILMLNTPLLTATHRQAFAADRRERPDPGGSRRGSLAADRPVAMGLRGISHFDFPASAPMRQKGRVEEGRISGPS